jgi:hypothetical protein
VQTSLNDWVINANDLTILKRALLPKNGVAIVPNQKTLEYAVSNGNCEIIQYLLDPENHFNLTINKNLVHHAMMSNNFVATKLLLHPNDHSLIKTSPDGINYHHKEEVRRLIYSHKFLFQVLDHLIETNGHDAKTMENNETDFKLLFNNNGYHHPQVPITYYLTTACLECPTYFIMMQKHILTKPALYQLNDKQVEFLYNKFKTIIEDVLTANTPKAKEIQHWSYTKNLLINAAKWLEENADLILKNGFTKKCG